MTTKSTTEWKDEFRDELYELYKKTCNQVYYPTTFWVALGQKGWLEHIKKFIHKSVNAEGIKKLIDAKDSTLAIEYIIIHNEKYHPLFTQDELNCWKETLAFMQKCIDNDITI